MQTQRNTSRVDAPAAPLAKSWHSPAEAAAILKPGTGKQEKVFAELKRSSDDGRAYVAFMRAFCPEEQRLIPLGKPARGPHGVMIDANIAEVPTEKLATAIDPKLVSADFLDSVGIAHEKQKKFPVVTSNLTRQLQVLFNGLISVPGTDGRIFVVGAGDELARKAGIHNPALTGSVLYLRSDPSGRNVLMHFPDLSSALRKTLHQLRHEDREIKQLAELEGDARIIVTKLGQWSDLEVRDRKALQREATAIAKSAKEALPMPRVDEKVRAGGSLMSAAGLKDRTGRINTSASIARYEWAAQRLAFRQREIGAIGGYNRKDQAAMLDSLYRNDRIFAHAGNRLEIHLNSVKNLAVFSGRLPESKRIVQLTNFLTSLGLAEDSRGTITTRPYLTFRDRLEEEIEVLGKASASANPEKGLEAVRNMYLITRLAGMQQKLNLARLDLVNGTKGIPEAAAQIGRLRKDFEALKESFGHPLESYPQSFKGFALGLTHAEKVLGYKNVPEKRHLQMIKRRLDKIDIERRLINSRE